jgi:hypothetical protein
MFATTSSQLIIIDEASIIPTPALHAMDRCMQDAMQDDGPFGGKSILLGGDFRQVLLHVCLQQLSLICALSANPSCLSSRHSPATCVHSLVKVSLRFNLTMES